MAKLNQALRDELSFTEREFPYNDPAYPNAKQILISTTHKEIYRQYSFIDLGNNTEKELHDLRQEVYNILTHAVDSALKYKFKNESK